MHAQELTQDPTLRCTIFRLCITGVLRDDVSGTPLSHVFVQLNGASCGTISKRDGTYALYCNPDSRPWILQFLDLDYAPRMDTLAGLDSIPYRYDASLHRLWKPWNPSDSVLAELFDAVADSLDNSWGPGGQYITNMIFERSSIELTRRHSDRLIDRVGQHPAFDGRCDDDPEGHCDVDKVGVTFAFSRPQLAVTSDTVAVDVFQTSVRPRGETQPGSWWPFAATHRYYLRRTDSAWIVVRVDLTMIT